MGYACTSEKIHSISWGEFKTRNFSSVSLAKIELIRRDCFQTESPSLQVPEWLNGQRHRRESQTVRSYTSTRRLHFIVFGTPIRRLKPVRTKGSTNTRVCAEQDWQLVVSYYTSRNWLRFLVDGERRKLWSLPPRVPVVHKVKSIAVQTKEENKCFNFYCREIIMRFWSKMYPVFYMNVDGALSWSPDSMEYKYSTEWVTRNTVSCTNLFDLLILLRR